MVSVIPLEIPSKITLPCNSNSLLKKTLYKINQSEHILTLWEVTNVTALKRMNMTDHGILHFQIVAETALKIARLMTKAKILFNVETDFNLSKDHAEVIIVLASLLHDVGMSIHRNGHEEYSLFLVNSILSELLDDLPIREKTIIISEVLHAIISHRKDGQPLTVEAGIVRVADALDMTEGRTRFPYQQGKVDIHSVSALAIDEVEIKKGKEKSLQIIIVMNHTAGIFQVDELLKKKINGSGIENYLDVKVFVDKGKGRSPLKRVLKQ